MLFSSVLSAFVGLTTFQLFAVYILLCAVFMYVVIMGPSKFHRDGCVGWLHRMLMRAPALLGTCCCLLCCCCRWRKAQRTWSRFEDGVMNKKHPGMVIFYVVVIGTAEFFYLSEVVPRLGFVERKAFSWFLIVFSEVTFLWACLADPGRVTPVGQLDLQRRAFTEATGTAATAEAAASSAAASGNGSPPLKFVSAKEQRKLKKLFLHSPDDEKRQNRRYVVDNILYAIAATQQSHLERPAPPPHGIVCSTCEVPRPSRSKHCKLCGHCVRRFDHHCPWINNDVGENNHRAFLAFLLSHVVSCYWASFDCWTILMQVIHGRQLLTAMFVNGAGRRVRATWTHVGLYLMNQETTVCCVLLFTILIGTLLLGFWGYQMRMVLLNATSNDLNKMDDVMEYLQRQPTAADLQREAKVMVQTIAQWTGRKVVLPPFPECLPTVPQTTSPSDAVSISAAAATVVSASVPLTNDQKKASKQYRKAVEKVLYKALRATFCTGSYMGNLYEVLFPHTPSPYYDKWHRTLAPGAARKERLFGAYRGDPLEAYANAAAPKKGSHRKKKT